MIKTSLAALGAACAITFASVAMAQEVKGNIVFLDWLGGGEGELLHKLEDGFKARNPGVTFTNVPVTFTADPRGGIRTVLGGGEPVDIMPNTWPAFRAELAEAGLLVPLDDMWKGEMGKNLSQAWRDLGSYNGTSYGVPWRYGNRSGLWFRTDVMTKNGLIPPKTYEEFVASFAKLNAAGVTPLAIPAKAWAHGEVFENLFVRMNGIDVAQQLVDHKIAWTDERVKAVFLKLAELLKANCCGDAAYMLGSEWDNAADDVLLNGKAGYLLIGTWVNTRAMDEYHLKPNVDYASIQFPAMGLGFDDTAIIDTREMNVISTGKNPEGAKAFIEYIASEEGSNMIAKAGLTPPSSQTDLSLLDPISAGVAKTIAASKVIFVLGDQLPGDVVDEFRVQLQHVIQDPSEAMIDKALAAIEAKAKEAY
jgi:ABC-type glycerol-3-phosphate transport system substrate-binding protein